MCLVIYVNVQNFFNEKNKPVDSIILSISAVEYDPWALIIVIIDIQSKPCTEESVSPAF